MSESVRIVAENARLDEVAAAREVERRQQDERRYIARGGRRITDVPKVDCPQCGGGYSCVIDTNGPMRRRQCACGHRYNTVETICAAMIESD